MNSTDTPSLEELQAARESLASLQAAQRALQRKVEAPFPKAQQLVDARARKVMDDADAEIDPGHKPQPKFAEAVKKLERELADFNAELEHDRGVASELQRRVDEARELVQKIEHARLLAAEQAAADEAQAAGRAVDEAIDAVLQAYAKAYATGSTADAIRAERTGQYGVGFVPSLEVDLSTTRLRRPHPSVGRWHPEIATEVKERAKSIMAEQHARLVAQGVRAKPATGAAPRVVARRLQEYAVPAPAVRTVQAIAPEGGVVISVATQPAVTIPAFSAAGGPRWAEARPTYRRTPMDTTTSTAATQSDAAVIPSDYAHLPEDGLVQITIKRGTLVVRHETEEYRPGSVLLVPPEEAARLKAAGFLGLDVLPELVQDGRVTPDMAQAIASGARVGSLS